MNPESIRFIDARVRQARAQRVKSKGALENLAAKGHSELGAPEDGRTPL